MQTFRFLKTSDASFLTDPTNVHIKHQYIDLLAILHDLLISLGGDPGHSVFEGYNIKIDRQLIQQLIDQLGVGNASIADTADGNSTLAFDLQRAAGGVNPNPSTSVAPLEINVYLNRLLQQYAKLRK